jgi:multidrug efflux system outer membrane protein
VFLLFPVRNAASLTLSLDDVLELGLENSLNLKKSLIDLSTAEYSVNKLWSEVFPAISGSLGATFSSPLASGGGFSMKDSVTTRIGVGVTLGLNAGIPSAMRNIRLAYQTRLLNYEDARNQLGILLTKNFYSLLADRDNLAVIDDMLRLAQLQYERSQIAFNNGLVGELTLMQSRLSVENARYSLSAARSAHATRMNDFFAQLGITLDTDAELEGKIEIVKVELDAERLILEYLPRRPDIISRRHEIERLENAERQNVLSARAPSLSLSVQWNGSRNTSNPNNRPNFDPFSDSLSGSATLNIPIDPWIPGTAREQSIRSARSAIDKARLELQSAEDAAVAQIRSLAANLRNSWDSIEIARLSLGVAERTYELTEYGFRTGTVDSMRLEDARSNLVTARQRLLQTELSYLTMILDISAALNIGWKDLMQ